MTICEEKLAGPSNVRRRFPQEVLQIWTNRFINNHPVTIIELISAQGANQRREIRDVAKNGGVVDNLCNIAGMYSETEVTRYPLAQANEALADLREGRLQGAAVLVP